MLKNKKGITLVALVITIVVLIILAGVSISLVLSNQGVLNKTTQGKTNYTNAQEEEQTQLTNVEKYINDATK